MQESEVFHMLQDFLDSVAMLIECSILFLIIPGIKWAIPESSLTCKPEVVRPRFIWNQKEQLRIVVEIVPYELSTVFNFFITHPIRDCSS